MKRLLPRAIMSLALCLGISVAHAGQAAAQPRGATKPDSITESDWRSLRQAISKAVPLQKFVGDTTGTIDDVATGDAFGDQFGTAVAVSGDTALVGVWLDDVGSQQNRGSAFVFVRQGSTWIQQAHLLASNGVAQDGFGRSVALEGDFAVIGAEPGDLGLTDRPGKAYVFRRTDGVWIEENKLIASDSLNGDQFGHSVAISGDTAVVGAP